MTTKTASEKLQVIIRRTLKVPVARAYKAWTDPQQMIKWMGCDQVEKIVIEQEFIVGGAYRLTGTGSEGQNTMSVHGVFKEIVENKKVTYTWNNESTQAPARDTLITVEFVDLGDGRTEIVFAHTKFADDSAAQGHSTGWNQSFDKLENLLAS